LKYVLIINSSPYTNQASLCAHQFAKALLAKEHELLTVFFYLEAAYHGLKVAQLPTHEINIIQLWHSLAKQHHLDLSVCSAAAIRRGIQLPTLPESEQTLFHFASLGYLFEICQLADKVISFG
jgi:tRNA 2-thiouridine synthesizing protein D